jgi:hypothetical protein
MLEELRWKVSAAATCMHIAACRAAGMAAVDAELEAAIGPAADTLAVEIAAAGWVVPEVLGELTALAADFENNRELVARTITRLQLPVTDGSTPVRVAGAIADLEAALLQFQPQLAEELAARVRPLREQWEARGPGMIQEIARVTESWVIPQSAEIVLVAPYGGGHGVAHVAQNHVTLEAVLFHPRPELPETVRLAWLLGQLNSDLPALVDVLPARRSLAAMRMAMIPPVLAAAEAVELARCDEATIAAALEAWQPQGAKPQVAGQLWLWWDAWLEKPAKWHVAVAALEQILQ